MKDDATAGQGLILDACVLIDFIKADRFLFGLIAAHVGQIHVPSPLVAEVREVSGEDELSELGITILEPDLDDALLAASGQVKSLSFQDQLCLLTAKRHGFVCVTNDRCLRAQCEQESVPLLWGLQLLLLLHRKKAIPPDEAVRLAGVVRRNNPTHITARLIERFERLIRGDSH